MSDLTTEELKWIKRVQRALDACPSDRMGFFTIGDRQVSIYNKSLEAKIEEAFDNAPGCADWCNAVDHVDADFDATLTFPNLVHSTAG